MPVTRCLTCGRGDAGYLDSEKELDDLTDDEVSTELVKYQAKEQRIRAYMGQLTAGTATPLEMLDGVACAGCGQGWREFSNHRRDLEQLTMEEARAALGNTVRWIRALQT
jgi:hypothetical protein